jgi:rhamnulokinase
MDQAHRFGEHSRMACVHWDLPRLWFETRAALSAAAEKEANDDTTIASIGVDSWGVDYALLGERGELLENPFHYRDPRNAVAMNDVLRLISKEEIYEATGIQLMPINTLNQLYAATRHTPRLLDAADRLLMIPDLFNYWLTGNAVCEFTDATTTQLVDPVARTWATTLMERLGIPTRITSPIVEPGSIVGRLLPGVSKHRAL